MQTIETSFEATTEVNRSKFIAYLVPIASYERDFGMDSVEWKIVGSEEKVEKFKLL